MIHVNYVVTIRMKREDRKSKAFISPGYSSKNGCEWISNPCPHQPEMYFGIGCWTVPIGFQIYCAWHWCSLSSDVSLSASKSKVTIRKYFHFNQ